MYDIATTVSRVANETYSHTRRIMPPQPWWEHLESSFHKFPDDFELDLRTEMTVDATALGDLLLRTTGASMLNTLALPSSFKPMQLKRDAGNRAFYQRKANKADPAAFFKRPNSSKVQMKSSNAGLLRFRPDDGSCRLLSFDSPFKTVNPKLREEYPKLKRNMRAVAQHWRHNNGPRPTIAVIHGFMADPYWVNRMFFALPWFYQQGYDILLYTLPHHGKRASRSSPFSGHGFFANGTAHINESFAHAVHDFRIFMDYLESEGVSKVGVTGISLGGYTSALLASVEDRLEFAIPNVPVVSLADLVLEWFPLNLSIKAMLKITGTSVRDIRHELAVHSALTYQPLLPKERLMVIAGAGDRLAPPKHARLLWDHWDRPRIHWFPGNHLVHLDKGKYLKEMAGFMRKIEFDRM
ncbi:MAG: alpha/beta hydrolase family protein [Halieaceae bacterium]|jgi:pimeloyl-ACP methyl ester carboxylesterase|nr:alpha/beta hydrolase family protein [Halieaceae bacterium]MBT6125053.1 alpha/beta hydrolase family protein [Halieaceae bacterium]